MNPSFIPFETQSGDDSPKLRGCFGVRQSHPHGSGFLPLAIAGLR